MFLIVNNRHITLMNSMFFYLHFISRLNVMTTNLMARDKMQICCIYFKYLPKKKSIQNQDPYSADQILFIQITV